MNKKIWFKKWNENLTHTLDYPAITLDQLFEKSAEWYPTKPFIIFYGKKLDYETTWKYILALSSALVRMGIKKGDRVGVSMQNSPNFVITYFGIIRAGGVVVLLNPMLKQGELENIVNDSGLKLIITTDDLLNNVTYLNKQLGIKLISGSIKPFLGNDGKIPIPVQIQKDYERGDALPWEDLIKGETHETGASISNNDPAMIAYTSGTTAIPKGCVHTHSSIIANAMASAYWRGVTPATIELSVAPFFHVTGLSFSLMGPLYESATIIPLYRWDKVAAVASIEEYGVTHWVTIPTMIADLLTLPDIKKHDFSSLVFVGGGGSAMPKSLLDQFEKIVNLHFVEGYGMTEMMGQTHVNPTRDRKVGSIGIPQFGVDSKIIDPETLSELRQGEIGEIVFTGPSLFSGYYGNDEETRNAFVELSGKKFLRSGDIGYMDEDGFFFIVDRLKRMINRAGFKVWPLEVENVLYEIPAIKECCVVSTPDNRVGEEVKAFITLKPGFENNITKDEIIQYCKSRLADYKYPRIIEFTKEIPKTGSGKVDWRSMQEEENRKSMELNKEG
ncbi:MAG: AMP-binding protein [Candidatus Micrarchaeaceae archaeon]